MAGQRPTSPEAIRRITQEPSKQKQRQRDRQASTAANGIPGFDRTRDYRNRMAPAILAIEAGDGQGEARQHAEVGQQESIDFGGRRDGTFSLRDAESLMASLVS